MTEMLNVVNEAGDIIGTETRDTVHRDGLLHREVNVWLYTPDGGIVFQHRSPQKQTHPDKLDASCAGHVDVGMGWLDTAVKELEEETGIQASPDELTFIAEVRTNTHDPATKTHNNALRRMYAYRLRQPVETLRIEPGEAVGFEVWPVQQLERLDKATASRFNPHRLTKDMLDLYRRIINLPAPGNSL